MYNIQIGVVRSYKFTCALYNVQYIIYIVQYTSYIVQFTYVYVYCTLYIYNVQCIVEHYTMYMYISRFSDMSFNGFYEQEVCFYSNNLPVTRDIK